LTLEQAKTLADQFNIPLLKMFAFADLTQKEKMWLLKGVYTYEGLVDRLNTLDPTHLIEEFRG